VSNSLLRIAQEETPGPPNNFGILHLFPIGKQLKRFLPSAPFRERASRGLSVASVRTKTYLNPLLFPIAISDLRRDDHWSTGQTTQSVRRRNISCRVA